MHGSGDIHAVWEGDAVVNRKEESNTKEIQKGVSNTKKQKQKGESNTKEKEK